MIVALMIGRAGSRGFPGKILNVLNKPMCEYPLLVAKNLSLLKKLMLLLIVRK